MFGIVFRLQLQNYTLTREKIMSFFSINIMYRNDNNETGFV